MVRYFVVGALLVGTLAGCVSSHVMIGQARPPIPVEQVKLYVQPPTKFEEIALLESSSKASWAITQQGKTNKALERLKQEAAKLGANGILLRGVGDQYVGAVNTGSATATAVGNNAYAYGSGVAMPVLQKSASGVAIFVTE